MQQMECRADLGPVEKKPEAPAEPAESTPPANGSLFPAEFLLPTRLVPAELLNTLASLGLRQTIDLEAFYLLCAAADEGTSQQAILLAQGVPPIPGADGWFEMATKTAGEGPAFEEDAQGNVDLRTLHSHTEIESGQKLGMVYAPQHGVAGLTADGLPIPAQGGKPFGLIAGEGVLLKYEGRIAFAEKSGRALLNRQTLAVVDELLIPGDLDLKTGNIDFHGFVEIRGDVPDDFSVKASKGMRISGTVGACRLEAGGPLEIGSMAGKGIGQILCYGDLKAGYLNQGSVACHGDILVTNEIRNSQVKATGKIVVERGSIIGGKALALEGIEAKILGATSCVRTHLVAGRYFPDTDRFDYLHQRRAGLDLQLKAIHEALGPLERLKEHAEDLANASKLRLSILNEQWEKLEKEKEQINSELAATQQQVFSSSNPKVNALTAIHEGVVVCLGQASERFARVLSGQISLIENTRQGGLRHLSLSPLSSQASPLEEELLQEEPSPDEEQPAAAPKGGGD